MCLEARWKNGCYGDLTWKGTEHNTNIMTDKTVTVCVWLSYRGWVRVPCSTRATWEIHWERMLLRSWLTFGWLHIWERNGQERRGGTMLRGGTKMYSRFNRNSLKCVESVFFDDLCSFPDHLACSWSLMYRLFFWPQVILEPIQTW